MSDNTYGSYGLHLAILNDPLGKKIKFDTLFHHLYNYWTLYHHPHQQILQNVVAFKCSLLVILEINLRRKWTKDLPNLNIVLEKYTEGDEFFNPIQFLEKLDNEKYLELLVDWKRKMKKTIYKLNLG